MCKKLKIQWDLSFFIAYYAKIAYNILDIVYFGIVGEKGTSHATG